jgi:hypothetical protein
MADDVGGQSQEGGRWPKFRFRVSVKPFDAPRGRWYVPGVNMKLNLLLSEALLLRSAAVGF